MRPMIVKKLVVEPSMRWMDIPFDSERARFGLYAFGHQETKFDLRHQVGGPAHSYWQLEKIRVEDLITRGKLGKEAALKFCEELDNPPRS